MPRRKSAIAPATRVRENQRRFRARRKELIEDLQNRLRKYEEKELQATLAMQLAARRIAGENAKLYDLLARKGVSTEEIKEFLCGRERMSVGVSSNAVLRTEVQSNTAAQAWGQDIGGGDQEDSRSTGEVDGQVAAAETLVGKLNEGVPRPDSSAHEPMPVDSAQASASAEDKFGCDPSDHPSTFDGEQSNMLPTVSECFCPALSTSNSFTGDESMLEMSCETAASIISGMRESRDYEQARSQLGCEGHEHCLVKNIRVLQVMEMD